MSASFNAILVSTSGMSFRILWGCCNILFRVIDSGYFFLFLCFHRVEIIFKIECCNS